MFLPRLISHDRKGCGGSSFGSLTHSNLLKVVMKAWVHWCHQVEPLAKIQGREKLSSPHAPELEARPAKVRVLVHLHQVALFTAL
jgi:hypothetical protein